MENTGLPEQQQRAGAASRARAGREGWRELLSPLVLVAALGYFVDIYDLLLFSIVRVPSLKELGLEGAALSEMGLVLLNTQMAGMLVGGIVFGVLGDRRGRLGILFASIIVYSIANFLNAYVADVYSYAALRFLAGIGLAGELGAGVTLVAEALSARMRGYGTMIVATVGVMGAVAASFVADNFAWRHAYTIGGVLGFVLLFLRVKVHESGLYTELEHTPVARGDFASLFRVGERFQRYALCLLLGLPFWYVVGILVTFSPEFAAALGTREPVNVGRSVLFCYAGLVVGDLLSGLLSQLLRSRKRVVGLFLVLCLLSCGWFLSPFGAGAGASRVYLVCFALGFSIGYWAVYITIAAEQFGTNLRATVATTVPNFARAFLIPISGAYTFLATHCDRVQAALWVGLACLAISAGALFLLKETFGRPLDFVERE